MFDLTKYTKVYVPSLTNSPKEIAIIAKEKIYPIKLAEHHMSLTKDGKHSVNASNPVIFPYTKEWYEKLKVVYPDLEPYKDEAKELLNLLEQQVDSVACKASNVSYEDARKNGIVVFKDYKGEGVYFVPINPFTLEECKTVEDYFKVPSRKMPF